MEDQKKQTLGDRLKVARGIRTQSEFAKSLGISLASYANYENGRRIPTGEVLRALSEQFDTDINWLLTGQEKREIGYVDYDEKIFKRIAATTFRELKKLDLLDTLTPEELAHALALINHTVMSTMGPEPNAEDVDLDDLEQVVRFVTKRR